MLGGLGVHFVREHDAPELGGLCGRHDTRAAEFEVEREEDGLEEGQDGGEYDEPHFDEVRDEAVVWDVAEGLVERAKPGLEELVEVFDENDG